MIFSQSVTALRMERQHLLRQADEEQYLSLYRDMQPGQNVYWNGFGDPPSMTFRAGFDDIEYNRRRQAERELIKGRFAGGNLGWIMREDLEIFAALYRKPLDKPTPAQLRLLDLIRREGPMNIQIMKEMTGMLVKEITPALHRLQQAFLIYEDQYDGEWDRGWYQFCEMFPDADLLKYSRSEALKTVMERFARRHVLFDEKMVQSFYRLPGRLAKAVAEELVRDGVLIKSDCGYLLKADFDLLGEYTAKPLRSVYAMHRNDFMVKSNEHALKEKFRHPEYDILQYLLIDGEFHGASVGHFKNGPYILEDIILDLPEEQAAARKEKILEAVHAVNSGGKNPVRRYRGEVL